MTTQNQLIILSVSEFTQAVKLTLESTFPKVWVKGEVSNLKLQTSGHLYFSLKDQHAQVACVCFRGDLLKVPLLPKDGDQVLIRAEMNVWPPKGGYQLVVRELSQVGLGDQLIKLELLKQKLNKLGYFSPDRKRPIPKFPKCIGIVTSPTGAVIQDILNILTRRMVGFHVILNPVKVQGEGADNEIAQAIYQFNRYQLADVLIVGRGGGSFEDLAPFNTEVVAKAIFESSIPIVSAVGHETDFSVADLVADLRAPTPSAAAEIISHEQEELLAKLAKYRKHIGDNLQKHVRQLKQELLKKIRHPVFLSSNYLLGTKVQLIDDISEQIDTSISRKVTNSKQDLARYKKSLELARPSNKINERTAYLQQIEKSIELALMRQIKAKKADLFAKSDALTKGGHCVFSVKKRTFLSYHFQVQIPQLIQKELASKKRKLETLKTQLESLDPKKILSKGYCILFNDADGKVISSVAQVQLGQEIRLSFTDGEAKATITETVS